MSKIIFAGNGKFALSALKTILEGNLKPYLVLTTPDKRTKREKNRKSVEIEKLAEENNIETRETKNKEELHAEVEKENPDAVIVASFGIIVSPLTLKLSKFVNLHPSLLPKYRGPTPIQSAILNGEEESGITLFLMDESVDTGSILAKKELPFHSKINYPEAEEMLAKEGGKLLTKNISDILNNNINPLEQNEEEATYTEILSKEDGRIDWSRSAKEIERKVRALNPWPGTFGKMGDKYFKVLDADIQEQTGNGPFGEPGKVYLGTNYTIAVQTGKDFLLIKSLQIEGKQSTNSKDFLQGNMSSMGVVLS